MTWRKEGERKRDAGKRNPATGERAIVFAAWSAKTQASGKGDGFLSELGFAGNAEIQASSGVIINELHQCLGRGGEPWFAASRRAFHDADRKEISV
jgi:hypothetical protein